MLRRVVRGFLKRIELSRLQEGMKNMEVNAGMEQLTAERRLKEIAACLAQGIFELHKRGSLATACEESSHSSPDALDFGADSGLSVNSGSISGYSNTYEGATNVVECH